MTTINTVATKLHAENRTGQPVDGPCPGTDSRDVQIVYPLAHTAAGSALDISLRKKSLLRLTGDHSGEKIFVEAGLVWITQAGSPEDIFLYAGESFDITQNGAILVEGVARTCLRICRTRSSFMTGTILGNAVQHILSSLPDRFV